MAYLSFVFFLGQHVCLAVSLALLFSRDRRKQFPFFFAYVAIELIYFFAVLAAYLHWILSDPTHTSKLFYQVLISGLGVVSILQFGVLYELASTLLFSRSHMAKIFGPIVRWAGAILLLSAALLSALLPQPGMRRLMSIFQTLDFSASLIEIGLLLVLLGFTSALNIPWKSLPAGIALGFGISAAAEMAGSALISALGKPGFLTVDLIRMAAFQVCTLIWLAYILRPERPPQFTGTGLHLPQLEVLDEQMQRMLRP